MANEFKLLVWDNGHLLQTFLLTGGEVTIGREPENALVINNSQVSRRHLRIFPNGQQWLVENLSQSNPARLQGQIVSRPMVWQPPDQIQLGTSITIQLMADPAQVVVPNRQPAPSVAMPPAQPNSVFQPSAPIPFQPSIAYTPAAMLNNVVQPTFASPQAADNGGGTLLVGSIPPTLRVTYSENNLEMAHEYILTKSRLTLGRVPENDIVIPIATVSRNHAVIEARPGGYTLIDQNSANGLLFKGERVQERLLLDGDIIRIGDQMGNVATLVFHDPTRPAVSQVISFKLDPTATMITIGRAPDNTLTLNHPQVSAHHAQIRREAGGTFVQDLHSTNGTFVRGQRVTPGHPIPINPGENLQVGNYQLVYQPGSIVQSDSSRVRIDALHIRKTVNNNSMVLLNDISITVQPKEFVALVGGSGAGKSTLMDALNGFRPATQGTVLLNGDDYYHNFAIYRASLGYVPQEDIIHRDLPVERALYYVARLRLPQDTSEIEIQQRVTEVLEDVEMTARRKVIVSRLSGGQRKRVSIAVELLAKPNLLFLDEPTSGLDPGLDKRMMFLLRRLADQGRTIVLVTHATNNITACDKVVFLAPGGKLAFFGPPKEALEFFEVKEFPDIYSKLDQNPASADEWEGRFAQSAYFNQYITQPQTQLPPPAHPPAYNTAVAPPSAPSMSDWRQFFILTRRYTELVVRDRVNLLVLILQAPVIAIILGIVAGANVFEPGHKFSTAQQVLFMLGISGVWLGTNNAAREITKENPIYLRERLVNLRVFPYIMSKVVVLSLLSLVQSFLLVGIILITSGAPPRGALFPAAFELIVGVWLTAMAGIGIGLLVSAIASNTDKAVSIVPIILIPQIILSGMIFALPGATKDLSFLTVSKWSLDSLGTSAGIDQLFFNEQNPPVLGNPACAPEDSIFDPRDYADNPCEVSDNGDFGQRGFHLLTRWTILSLMIVAEVGGTCYLQKRKDKAWERT